MHTQFLSPHSAQDSLPRNFPLRMQRSQECCPFSYTGVMLRSLNDFTEPRVLDQDGETRNLIFAASLKFLPVLLQGFTYLLKLQSLSLKSQENSKQMKK